MQSTLLPTVLCGIVAHHKRPRGALKLACAHCCRSMDLALPSTDPALEPWLPYDALSSPAVTAAAQEISGCYASSLAK
eukprot:195021-Amphidinium_carterae.1